MTCYTVTEGSKLESRYGAGHVITTNNNNTLLHKASHQLPNCCSVLHQVELTALTKKPDTKRWNFLWNFHREKTVELFVEIPLEIPLKKTWNF